MINSANWWRFGKKNQAKYNRKSSCGMREAIPGIALNLKTNCLLTLSTLQATSHRPLLNIDCESAGIYVKKYNRKEMNEGVYIYAFIIFYSKMQTFQYINGLKSNGTLKDNSSTTNLEWNPKRQHYRVKMPVYIDNCTSKLRGVAAEGGSGVLNLAEVKIL